MWSSVQLSLSVAEPSPENMEHGAYAILEDLDQSAHPRSLILALVVHRCILRLKWLDILVRLSSVIGRNCMTLYGGRKTSPRSSL